MEHDNRREWHRVVVLASLVSILAFCWYYSHGEILLYGDAVAHINIARRVFDSRSPGPLQLGTVWLPFPHVVMIPFLVNDWMWRTGIGGAIPSMLAYVLGVLGVFRLVRGRQPAYVAWAAAAIYGLNPNLLYMQTTAMNEPLMMCELVWALVYLDELQRALAEDGTLPLAPHQAVERCAMVLAAAILTRYDGWILAAACGIALAWMLWRARDSHAVRANLPRIRRSTMEFFALCALVPVLWLAQNYAITANPLDFINGPYSAKAIEARTSSAGMVGHPGQRDPLTAMFFYFKSAKLNLAPDGGSVLFVSLLLLGAAYALRRSGMRLWLLLLLPLPFYVYSVGWGSIPIFMPVWWPHSYYNVRYGLEMLPAFAVLGALAIGAFANLRLQRPKLFAAVITSLLLAGCYLPVQRETPICLREAQVNSRSRIALEDKLAAILRDLRGEDGTVLMYTGEYVGALQKAGIPLRHTINETVHPDWDEALTHPARSAQVVVAIKGDGVWYASRLFPQDLHKYSEFEVEGKPPVVVYVSHIELQK